MVVLCEREVVEDVSCVCSEHNRNARDFHFFFTRMLCSHQTSILPHHRLIWRIGIANKLKQIQNGAVP
jgi:hypothetical protein